MVINHKRTIVLLLFGLSLAVSGIDIYSQTADKFLGIKLRPEIGAIVKEVEAKTGAGIHAEFIAQTDHLLASSFIDDNGVAIVLVDLSLRGDLKKLEAVITHELLHLRLRVNNYPTFIFSQNVRTARGRAIDVEQDNINDLKDLIEHRVFRAEMERYGLYDLIDLAGDTAADARNRHGQLDGQADAINYARAVLEYKKPQDIRLVRQIYEANGWTRSLETGAAISDIISRASIQTPKDVESVFLNCILKLYSSPKRSVTFKLTPDASNKHFRRLVVRTASPDPKGGKVN